VKLIERRHHAIARRRAGLWTSYRSASQDELVRFFKSIRSARDRALVAVIYHYGLRVSEATTLTVDDIDIKNLRIRLRRLKSGIGGEKPLWRHTARLLRAAARRSGHQWWGPGRRGEAADCSRRRSPTKP